VKKFLLFIIVLLLLLIAAGAAAPYFISAADVKNQIIQKVEFATGRKLTIDGELHYKLFPVAGIAAEKVSLSNPDNFGDQSPFVTMDSLTIDVALMPLLQRNIVIDRFILEAPKVNLHQNKDGIKNWSFAKSSAPAAEPSVPQEASAPSPLMALPGNLRLSNVSLKNATITYTDDTAKTSQTIDKLNATLALDGIDSPLKLEGSGQWSGKIIDVRGNVSTVQSLLRDGSANLDLAVNSDLIAIKASGDYQSSVFTGKAGIKSSSIKNALAWLIPAAKPLPTPAPLDLDASGNVKCSAKHCDIDNLVFALDNVHATGGVKIAMEEAKPSVDLDLAVEDLDFNPFLGTEKKAADLNLIRDANAETAGHWSTDTIDLSALNMLNLTATIKADGIKYKNITIGESELNAKIENGHLTAAVKDAELYSGKGNFSLDIDGAAIKSHTSLEGVQLEPLLKDAADMNRITGKADVTIDIASQSQSQQAIVSALSGSGQIKVGEGEFKGVNILAMLQNITGAANGTPDTKFSEMSGTFTIAKGIVSNQDLKLVMSGLSVSGKGTIDLPAYTINYRLTPQVMGKSQTGTAAGGLSVPVVIQGSLDQPAIKPDVGGAIKNIMSDPTQLKNTERSIKQQLKNPQDAVKNIKGLLKGLQGN